MGNCAEAALTQVLFLSGRGLGGEKGGGGGGIVQGNQARQILHRFMNLKPDEELCVLYHYFPSGSRWLEGIFNGR